MTGVSPFLYFHKHTIITIKDATLMSQSFTSMDAGTQTLPKTKRKCAVAFLAHGNRAKKLNQTLEAITNG